MFSLSALFRVLTDAVSAAPRAGLAPAWSHTVEGVIWRIAPAEAGLLVGETRNLERKTASFFCLDCRTGAALWEGVVLSEGWWVGIEAVFDGVLFVHGFASPELPAHRGITALDLHTGSTLWRSDDMEFVGVRPESVLAVRGRFSQRELLELDPHTGAVRRAQRSDEETIELLRRCEDRSRGLDVLLPVPLGEDASSHRVRDHLRAHGKPLGAAESVEWVAHEAGDVVIVHERAAGGEEVFLNAVLTVLEPRTGRLLYRATIASGLRRPVPDVCFVWNGMLYFLRERASLVALALAPSS